MPRPALKSIRVPLLMLLAGTLAFIAIAADVVCHGKLQQLDGIIAPYIHEHSIPLLVAYSVGFSALGEIWITFPLTVLVALFLIWKRQWRSAAVWLAAMVGSAIICQSLKKLFAIPRPSRFSWYTFDEHSGFTFPSGHTMGVMIYAGTLALIWMRWRPRPRKHRLLAAASVLLLSIMVAASLLYIGVHYLTDVLSAMAISTAWLGVMRFFLPPAAADAYDAPSQTQGVTPDVTAEQIHRPADTRAL